MDVLSLEAIRIIRSRAALIIFHSSGALPLAGSLPSNIGRSDRAVSLIKCEILECIVFLSIDGDKLLIFFLISLIYQIEDLSYNVIGISADCLLVIDFKELISLRDRESNS